jgi:hypothetical protein
MPRLVHTLTSQAARREYVKVNVNDVVQAGLLG